MNEFEQLLNNYIDDDVIREKIEAEDLEYAEDQKMESKKSDISALSGYAITIPEFVNIYLNETPMESTGNLTHKQFKELTKDNPLVVGIFNGLVDVDEVAKQDCIIVMDCFGNLGSYLNPERLRDFTRLEIVEKEYRKIDSMMSYWCEHVKEHLRKYCLAYKEYKYLEHKCKLYEETLYKVHKKDKVRKLKKYVDKHGTNAIGIEEE